MFNSRLELIVLFLMLILLAALFSVAIFRARSSAQEMQSQNNLKQLGLGVHNFELTFKHIPSGCDSEAKHGWMTRVFPYMEASGWYSSVDHDVSWEHALNRHQFSVYVSYYCLPTHGERYTEEGYGTTDYHANQVLMYRGSSVKFKDLANGLSNTLMIGEINSHQTPFGYPYNWRDASQVPNQGADSFGAWKKGAYFVLADGAIRLIENDIDSVALRALASGSLSPASELVERPDRLFKFTRETCFSRKRFSKGKQNRVTKGGPAYSEVILGPEGDMIDFQHGMVDVAQVLAEFPHAKVLRIAYPQNTGDVELISKCFEVETVCLLRRSPSRDGSEPMRLPAEQLIATLSKLKHLRTVKLEATEEEFEQFRKALPNCDMIRSTSHSPYFYSWE